MKTFLGSGPGPGNTWSANMLSLSPPAFRQAQIRAWRLVAAGVRLLSQWYYEPLHAVDLRTLQEIEACPDGSVEEKGMYGASHSCDSGYPSWEQALAGFSFPFLVAGKRGVASRARVPACSNGTALPVAELPWLLSFYLKRPGVSG